MYVRIPCGETGLLRLESLAWNERATLCFFLPSNARLLRLHQCVHIHRHVQSDDTHARMPPQDVKPKPLYAAQDTTQSSDHRLTNTEDRPGSICGESLCYATPQPVQVYGRVGVYATRTSRAPPLARRDPLFLLFLRLGFGRLTCSYLLSRRLTSVEKEIPNLRRERVRRRRLLRIEEQRKRCKETVQRAIVSILLTQQTEVRTDDTTRRPGSVREDGT